MKVSKLGCFLLLAILTTSSSYSQDVDRLGLKIGINRSDIRYDDPEGSEALYMLYGSVINPSISVFYRPLISTNLYVESDLTYTRKGTSERIEFWANSELTEQGVVYTEIGTHYLQLGLTAQPRLPIDKGAGYLSVGSSLNYMVGTANLADVGDRLSRFQIGYNLGVGFDFGSLVEHGLFVEIKYSGDFSHFYQIPEATYWNRVWLINLGVTVL
jgi:hypothetical protein